MLLTAHGAVIMHHITCSTDEKFISAADLIEALADCKINYVTSTGVATKRDTVVCECPH